MVLETITAVPPQLMPEIEFVPAPAVGIHIEPMIACPLPVEVTARVQVVPGSGQEAFVAMA